VREREDLHAGRGSHRSPTCAANPSLLTALEKTFSAGYIWVIYTPLCFGTQNPANDGDLRWGLKCQTNIYVRGCGETESFIYGTDGPVYPRSCIFGICRRQTIDGAAFVKFDK